MVTAHLNRERILTAAFEILDEYGLGDLTMRRLARHLGVAPGALYWHFPSKQELLGGISDRILGEDGAADDAAEAAPTSAIADWRTVAHATAATLLDRLLSTRDGAEIVSAALASGTATVDPAEAAHRRTAGRSGRRAGRLGADPRYLLGAATDLQTAVAAGAEPRPVAHVMAGVDLVLGGIPTEPTG